MINNAIKYRADIDGLRAIAVGAVLFFHAFPKGLPGGFIGVDIFFVISGYLISSIIFNNLDNRTFSFADFFARRIKRIFPALSLVLISSYIYGYFYLLPIELAQLGKHILSGAAFISNFALWGESGYFDAAAETKPLLHLWSLAIEEQFYIIWPLVLFFVWKRKKFVLPLIIGIILFSFVANVYYINEMPGTVFYLPFFRFWEILCGTLLAYLVRYRSLKIPANISSTLGLILISLGIVLLDHSKAFPGWWALLPVLGTCFIIAAGENASFNKRVLSHPKMIWVGLISYPLYLWHWPILSFLRIWKGRDPSNVQAVLAVILSIVLAWMTFKFVEKPLRKVQWKIEKVPAFSGAMAVLAIIGLLTHQNQGFPSRFPEEIRNIAAITDPYKFFEYDKHYRVGLCHSPAKEVDLKTREENCIDKTRPLVFLWGDSYAASLYPGLKALQNKNKNFGIAQFTAGNAPPFLKMQDHNIAETMETITQISDRNLGIIKKHKPEFVMISWMYSQKNKLPLQESISALQETIHAIKNASLNTHIIVVGPVPHWKGSLSKSIMNYWLQNKEMIPKYSKFGLNDTFIDWDRNLDSSLDLAGVTYISPYRIMCNQNGCLTRTGPETLDLTAVDWGHLSPASSKYLVEQLGILNGLK